MAEVIYPRTSGAFVDGDRFTVVGDRPGPAGISSVTFANGDIWQVDHANPSRLVVLESDAAKPASSPVLAAALGGDEVLFLIDAARDPDDVEWDDFALDKQRSRQSSHPWGRPAHRAGQAIVLADLADDGRLHPLARIAAAVELTVSLRASPIESLLAPVAASLLTHAQGLADQFDTDDLNLIDPKDAAVLRSLLQQLEPPNRFDEEIWSQLADRLRWDQPAVQLAAAADFMRDVDAEFSMDSPIRETARALRTFDRPHEMRRIDDAVVEVVVAREDHERWVRVFQRDGLMLLGQAPLRREGLVDVADVVIPADLTDDQLEYEVVDAADMAPPPERPIERVRAAITAGREAARADRADIPNRSRPRWERCAELWERAGDRRRALMARQLAEDFGGSAGFRPVADRLAEDLAGSA